MWCVRRLVDTNIEKGNLEIVRCGIWCRERQSKALCVSKSDPKRRDPPTQTLRSTDPRSRANKDLDCEFVLKRFADLGVRRVASTITDSRLRKKGSVAAPPSVSQVTSSWVVKPSGGPAGGGVPGLSWLRRSCAFGYSFLRGWLFTRRLRGSTGPSGQAP